MRRTRDHARQCWQIWENFLQKILSYFHSQCVKRTHVRQQEIGHTSQIGVGSAPHVPNVGFLHQIVSEYLPSYVGFDYVSWLKAKNDYIWARWAGKNSSH